jgi:dienelactone hydrolase
MAEADASPRMKASDFHPYILEIFDGYVHGKLTKREFIREAGKFAAAGVTGLMILQQLAPDYALAQQVKADDPAIITQRVEVPSPEGHGSINGLLARPAKAKGKLPAVLVIHENRGLNPYIEDVARRLAKAGYLALAPDGLSSVGGYPGNDDKGRELQAKLNPAKLLEDFFASFEYLRDHKDSTGKVGAVGFCYGGGVCRGLSRPRRFGSLLWPPTQGRGSPRDQGPVADPLCRSRRAHQRRLAALSGGADFQPETLRSAFLPGHAAWLPQRQHPALRQGGSGVELVADPGLFQGEFDGLRRGCLFSSEGRRE